MAENERREILQVETRKLPVKLTLDELIARADEMARVHHEIRGEEADQVNAKAAMKERLGSLQKRFDALSDIVHSKSEVRDVEVKVRLVTEQGIVETYRVDTGDTVEKRVMTVEERNLRLFPRQVENEAGAEGTDG